MTLAQLRFPADLRPLAETAALFRQECSALDHLVEDLYRDVDQLRNELVLKSEELAAGRQKLAERGAQLAEQRKESTRLVHVIENQESKLAETLAEVRALREQTAHDQQQQHARDEAQINHLQQQLRSLDTEREKLRQEVVDLHAAVMAAGDGDDKGEALAPLVAELSEVRRHLGDTLAELSETRSQLALAATPPVALPPTPDPAVAETLAEVKALREQAALDKQQQQEHDAQHIKQLHEQLRSLETEREKLRQEVAGLHAAAIDSKDDQNQSAALAPLVAELSEVRRHLAETLTELSDTRGQLAHAAAQAAVPPPPTAPPAPDPAVAETLAEVKAFRKQAASERKQQQERDAEQFHRLQQQLQVLEAEREKLRQEVVDLHAARAVSESTDRSAAFAPLVGELNEVRRQLAGALAELSETRQQVALVSEQAATAVPVPPAKDPAIEETLAEVKALREQASRDRQQQQQQHVEQISLLREQLKSSDVEREKLQQQVTELHVAAIAAHDNSDHSEALAPFVAELAEVRSQLAGALAELSETRAQLAEASAPAPAPAKDPAAEEALTRVGALERERIELESELELVRTRATELQEVVQQQRRELVEQRADITTQLRLLRELVEQQRQHVSEPYEPEPDSELVGASAHAGVSSGSVPDPVVSSVMAQFARLQQDVIQRRKKK